MIFNETSFTDGVPTSNSVPPWTKNTHSVHIENVDIQNLVQKKKVAVLFQF